MMRKLILMLALLTTALYSCEKDDHSVNNLKSDYIPMAVGNYWVYEIYNTQPNGYVRKYSYIDSIVIVDDTLVNESMYYKFEYFNYYVDQQRGTLRKTEYFKDSCKYLVDIDGRKLFSENNFTDTLVYHNAIHNGDTLYTSSYKMETVNNVVDIPAGSFNNVLNFKGTVYSNPIFTEVDNPGYLNKYYACSIGVVYDSYFYLPSGSREEKKLVRYELVGDK